MAGAFQGSLLDLVDQAGPGPLGDSVRRRALAHGAWVDIRPGWLAGADELFEPAAAGRAVAGRAAPHVRPGGGRAAAAVLLRRGRAAAGPGAGAGQGRAQRALRAGASASRSCTAGLCLYRDGRDSVAWHGDTIGRGATQDTVVAIVSLGTPRARSLLRPRGGGPAIRYDLGHGDLLVMGGSCQRTWEHAVPKTARASRPPDQRAVPPQGSPVTPS